MQNLNQNEFSTRVPKLGETVIFFPNPDDSVARSNGNQICVALITNVWSSIVVNIKILPDHGPVQDRGSVSHFSANPAGYHFMFQDEYEEFLKLGIKDFGDIKNALIEKAELFIRDCSNYRSQAKELIDKAKSSVSKSDDLINKAKTISSKAPQEKSKKVDLENFGPTY